MNGISLLSICVCTNVVKMRLKRQKMTGNAVATAAAGKGYEQVTEIAKRERGDPFVCIERERC